MTAAPTESASRPVLVLESVHRAFHDARGPVPVLTGLSLTVAAGDFVIITGPSGSGKSTLLGLAGLLDTPDGGRLEFAGQDAASLSAPARAALRATRIGMVFQAFHLLPDRSVLENVLFRWRYVPTPPPADAVELARNALERLGLAPLAHRPARLLSQGQMQRVAIARAIVVPPVLLLADEPTGNLDAASAETVLTTFRTLHAAGMTILMVTHNPALIPYGSRHLRCASGGLTEVPPS